MANDGFSLTLTPTVGTGAYIVGDGVGGILDFGSITGLTGEAFEINSIELTDKSKSHPALLIEFFIATPNGGTYTDSSPLVYAAGDAALSIPLFSVLAENWQDLPLVSSVKSKASFGGRAIPITLTGSHLFALIHANSAFTLTNGDLIITVAGKKL